MRVFINSSFLLSNRFVFLMKALFLLSISLHAQQTPAPPQQESILISGVTAHIGNGETIENAAIGFENGVINFVGFATEAVAATYSRVIDGEGGHVYPGFIAVNSHLGLVEIDAVRATRDQNEVGQWTPNVRAAIAYNTDSRVTPTVRANGTLLAHIMPMGGTISGTSALMQTDAWNWEDAVVKKEAAVHLFWPSVYQRTGWWAEPGPVAVNEAYNKSIREIEDYFQQAKAYMDKDAPNPLNLPFEAMRGVFSGEKRLFVHANEAKAMQQIVHLFTGMDIKPVLSGANEAWMITDFLKQNDIELVLNQTHRLPDHPHSDIDLPFKLPALLYEAGIPFVITNRGAWQQRNLPYQAGHAIGYGLPYHAAVTSLTLTPARIFGVDESFGSLEPGKSATLFLSSGDALDIRSNHLLFAFIDGRSIDLDNKQEALYRKFLQKYAD